MFPITYVSNCYTGRASSFGFIDLFHLACPMQVTASSYCNLIELSILTFLIPFICFVSLVSLAAVAQQYFKDTVQYVLLSVFRLCQSKAMASYLVELIFLMLLPKQFLKLCAYRHTFCLGLCHVVLHTFVFLFTIRNRQHLHKYRDSFYNSAQSMQNQFEYFYILNYFF